jgi:uncharacterized cofD-like protein
MSKRRRKISFKRKQRIVCFGGGNLVPKVILEPLKRYPVEITAVTSMTEGGGSTGQLRNDFNVLPSGDISRHLVALSGAPRWKRDLFYSRFGREKFSGGHVGHRFGTVFISLAEHFLGSFEKALRFAHEFLEVKEHKALPATTNNVQLMAELENGKIIEGEDEIDVPKKHKPGLKIRKVFLKPKARIFPPVRSAIIGADLIVLGPGDFYSSTIPCLLPHGIKTAFKKSKAKKVFICNTITKLGETNGFSVLDFVGEVEKYIGVPLDFVVYHRNGISQKEIGKYKRINRSALKPVRVDRGLSGRKFIGENLLLKTGSLDFNSDKLAKIIFNLCKQ